MNKQKTIVGAVEPRDLPKGRAAKLCGCGNWFTLPACHANRHKSCTDECARAFRRAESESAAAQRRRDCKVCGKSFVPRQWQLDNGIGVVCSQACNYTFTGAVLSRPDVKAKAKDGYRSAMRDGRIVWPLGPAHPSWKGGVTVNQGYRRVNSKAGYVAEHRAIAEQMIGRSLLPGEVVHHKNRIRSDNRPENLQVMTEAEHAKEHEQDRMRNRPAPRRGEAVHTAKLTEAAVREIRAHSGFNTQIAAKYGVTSTLIGMVKSRKIWRHV